MKDIFKKGDNMTIEQILSLHHSLLRKFIEIYGKFVLVHSTTNEESFKQILKQAKIKLPSQHKGSKKEPYIEKLIGAENYIYYSLGFPYATRYKFKYSLLFSLDYLKELDYYKKPFIFTCCREIANYWDRNDPEELQKLAKKNKTCEKVIFDYYNKKRNGRVKVYFEFWKIEKELTDSIRNYKDKKKLFTIIEKTRKRLLVKYPYSKANAKTQAFSGRMQEIMGKKQADLKTNPYFLGFYISGNIPLNIQFILKKDYGGKLLFDGKKIKEIK